MKTFKTQSIFPRNGNIAGGVSTLKSKELLGPEKNYTFSSSKEL